MTSAELICPDDFYLLACFCFYGLLNAISVSSEHFNFMYFFAPVKLLCLNGAIWINLPKNNLYLIKIHFLTPLFCCFFDAFNEQILVICKKLLSDVFCPPILSHKKVTKSKINLLFLVFEQNRAEVAPWEEERKNVWGEQWVSASLCVCEDWIISARLTQDLPPAVVYAQPSAWKLMVIMWSSLRLLLYPFPLRLASFCSSSSASSLAQYSPHF